MALCEDIIFADPVLQRVFLSDLQMCAKPGTFVHYNRRHRATRVTFEAELNCLDAAISELKVDFFKTKNFYEADRLRLRIRNLWFQARDCSEGYFLRLPSPGSHVALFSHDCKASVFSADLSKLAGIRIRYTKHQRKVRAVGAGL